MELLLLHNEKNYVVAVKPRGVLSQCASSVTGNVPDMVKLLSERLQADIFPVHRLDRETAGVMVYAKNKRAAAAFSALAAQNGLDKRYLAAVTGKPEPPSGEMRDFLYHDVRKNKSYVVSRKRAGVKEALLDYALLDTRMYAESLISLVRIHLHTGRTHQIRVHMASIGHPLLGDTLYSSGKSPYKLQGQTLHAMTIGFIHPRTREYMEVTAPLPEYFEKILKDLR